MNVMAQPDRHDWQPCVCADEALQFIHQYTAGWSGNVSVMALALDGSTKTKTVTVDRIDELGPFIEARNGICNLYFGANPLSASQDKKATKDGIAALAYLHADLDPRDGFDLDAERERLKKLIDEFPVKPNLIIDSGGGFQVFWRLREPVLANGNIDRLEGYNRSLAACLGGDDCWNIDRLMRLPGTVNLPDAHKRERGRQPAFAQVVYSDEGGYALEDFDALLGGMDGAQAHAGEEGDHPKVSVEDLRISEDLKALIRAGKPQGERSEAVFGVGRAMVKAGHSDDEIVAVLMDPANALSEKPREKGSAWLRGEARRAREKPDKEGVEDRKNDDSTSTGGKASGTPLDNVINAADLVGMELPEPRWIMPGLVPEGLTLLAGKSKAGKSWWVLQTAIEVARDQGEVLYLALEDTKRRLQERIMRRCGGKESVPARLKLLPQSTFPRLDAGGLTHIRQWLTEHGGARLIIVDTLAKVKPRGKRNASPYDEDYAALEGLKQLADEFHVGIIVVHHLRKMADPDDPFNEISGTTGLMGCADTAMVLRRPRSSNKAELFVTGRDVESQQIPMTWEPGLYRWTVGEDREPDIMHESRRAMLDLLRQHGPMTMKQIVEAAGEPEGTIKARLSRMVDDGQLVNQGGKYCIPETDATAETGATHESV